MADPLKIPQFNSEENEWFQRELHPHASMLRSWLAARFPSISDFEDLIQDAYIRTVKRHRKKRLSAAKPFLFATARNLCIDSLRRDKLVRFEPLAELDSRGVWDQAKGVPDRIVAMEEYEILARAIESLPKKCRRVFTLRKIYGLPLRQIANELGISVKTVEAQISIGVKRCREFFLKLQDEVNR